MESIQIMINTQNFDSKIGQVVTYIQGAHTNTFHCPFNFFRDTQKISVIYG